jgi:hypothetical protein
VKPWIIQKKTCKMKTRNDISRDLIRNMLFPAIIILAVALTGCKFYYQVETVKPVAQQQIHAYKTSGKYLIVHQGNQAWNLVNPGCSAEHLSGVLSTLPADHMKYKATNPNTPNRYLRNRDHPEMGVLEEVHLYVNDYYAPWFATGDSIRISYANLNRAEVYVKDKGKTTSSWVVPALVTPIVVVGVVAAIAALTKSSCPLIYIKNGSDFTFAGEIFGGAVYASIERHDYLPLPGFQPFQNRYSLVISNGLPEIQYINLAELWIVNHPAGMTVLPDRQGVIHSVANPELPLKAVTTANRDISSLIAATDKDCFLFDETPAQTGDTCAFNTAVLTFSLPGKADTGKLILRAGNSVWGDYTYGEFTKFFGSYYSLWIKAQGYEPAEKNNRWKLDQRFALMVYLETRTGWQFVDFFDLIGPLGARDLIMPVDLKQALITESPEQGKQIRVRLESGFKLWDLDYAAMDFSTDATLLADRIKPASALTESKKDVKQSLTENDSQYYVQLRTGESGMVEFKDSREKPGMIKSVILHTKGYYEHVRNYPNPPDWAQLQTFLIPGRFSKYSYDNHEMFTKNNWVIANDQQVP